MITCKVCNKEFQSMITWRHLATHQLSISQYKAQYGSVVTDDYRQLKSSQSTGDNNPNFGRQRKLSEEHRSKLRGRTPHNKGKKVTDAAVLANIREGIARREQRFQNGEISRGAAKTAEQKQILSEKTTNYARSHADKVKERAKKALETKKTNGYDFGKPMRGKRHLPDAIEKIREATVKRNVKRSEKSWEQVLNMIHSSGLALVSTDGNSMSLSCDNCKHVFSMTRQYFTPSKHKLELCPVCYPRHKRTSIGETELFEFIRDIMPDAVQSFRESYRSKELDIFVPSKNIAFEFNGLYWHGETVRMLNGQDPKGDYRKMREFEERGIRVVTIFEDEWVNKRPIVESRIKSLLGVVSNKVYARTCQIKEVDSKTASAFCEQNHIMGKARSNVRYGLFHQGQLVSLMTFSKSNISRKVNNWEINRFCSKLGINVVGGASKLFSKFVRDYGASTIFSYADNRWSTGDLYLKLGFTKVSEGTPNYWYVKPNVTERIHRFTLRKNHNDCHDLTEVQNRQLQGYDRIWDCGSSKWVYTPVEIFSQNDK